jgi:hypothetical protein
MDCFDEYMWFTIFSKCSFETRAAMRMTCKAFRNFRVLNVEKNLRDLDENIRRHNGMCTTYLDSIVITLPITASKCYTLTSADNILDSWKVDLVDTNYDVASGAYFDARQGETGTGTLRVRYAVSESRPRCRVEVWFRRMDGDEASFKQVPLALRTILGSQMYAFDPIWKMRLPDEDYPYAMNAEWMGCGRDNSATCCVSGWSWSHPGFYLCKKSREVAEVVVPVVLQGECNG